MFLPWPIFALNAYFVLFELLVALTFNATLAVISLRVEGYAQSIRWIHQAGIFEIVTTLWVSKRMRKKLPLCALLTTLLINGALFVIITGTKSFVNEAVAEGNYSQELVSSSQHTIGEMVSRIAGWTFPVPFDTDMEEALTMAVSSRGNPRSASTKRYRPRVSEHELVCDRLDFRTPNRTLLAIPNDSCASVTLTTSGIVADRTDLSKMYIIQKSKDRTKVVIPAPTFPEYRLSLPNNTIENIGVVARVDYLGRMCLTPSYNSMFIDADHAGITSSPRTTLTKCLLATGDSVILSTSAIRFTVPRNEMFNSVASSIFGTQNELVKGMQDSVNNGTLTTLPANVLEELTIIEAKMTDTEITALVCVWSRFTIAQIPHIACAYTINNVAIIKPQPMIPDVERRLVNKGLNPTWTNVTTTIALTHNPQVSKETLLFDIPKILNASAVATHYFASLGNNFILDWEGSMLHVVFDTSEILNGYEIPRWLFFSIIGVMAICLSFLAATRFLVDARFRNSLYMTVSKELSGGENDTEPRLHRFDPETLKFEGRRGLVIPKAPPQESEDGTVYHGQAPSSSQDPLTAV